MTVDELKAARLLVDAASSGPWEPRRMPGAHPDHDAQFIACLSG